MDSMDYINRMNASVLRANAFHDKRAQEAADFETQRNAGELADARQARDLRGRQFDEQRRRYDQQLEMFRSIFGGGQQQPRQTNAFAMPFADQGQEPMRDANDGLNRPQINNALSRFLLRGF